MSQSAEIKNKLETAIKNSKAGKEEDNQKAMLNAQSAVPAPGTIKLKTDFSNFT
jgi:hypothetical protein